MARVAELTMAGGNRRMLLLALIAGLVAAIVVFVAVQSSGGDSSSSSGPVTAAVVAAADIAAGSTIKAGDVTVTDVPNSLLVAGAFTDTSAAVGQAARVAIAQGEQISPNKVGSPAKSANGLNSVLPQGKRAMAVPVEQVTAVGGNLLPGDRVDVLAVFNDQASGGTVVSTILQNVEILAVAQEAQTPVAAPASGSPDQSSISGQLPTNPKSKPDAKTVTLAVDPQQAELLAGIQETARKIYLTLRSYGDQSISEITPVNVNESGGQ